jgi:hypothetical protein
MEGAMPPPVLVQFHIARDEVVGVAQPGLQPLHRRLVRSLSRYLDACALREATRCLDAPWKRVEQFGHAIDAHPLHLGQAVERADVVSLRPKVGPDRAHLERIVVLVNGGAVRVPEIKVPPLSEGAAAHKVSEGRHLRGKLVFKVR